MEIPKFITESDKEFALRNFRIPKCRASSWKEQLGWAYSFPWREEQLKIIQDFQQGQWETFVVQAIFGGGKTTMIIATIFDLVLQGRCSVENILICAFNVAIKNEIKKKVKILGNLIPRTFDSIVYQICKEMDYVDLKHPNFLEKRKYLFKNILQIPQVDFIQYIFLDEAQDLERSVESILRRRFPNAKMIIVGDIFQSIQKEPRESLLWHLIDNPREYMNVYKMLETPRVPRKILDNVQKALYKFYPEFGSTILGWNSSSTIPSKGIEWSLFKGYKEIYQKIDNFIVKHGIRDSMILVFSSAMTVRGKLGDVSRVRRHLVEKGFKVNSNHKLMRDDAVFLSTANSSKGLERKHVLCILSFPLELAFANFSNDVLMNLVTVAMSRCKESIHFSLPCYMDRYSPLLEHYSSCPRPYVERALKRDNPDSRDFLLEEEMSRKTTMLQKEHSVTEILQLQIISFQTKQKLIEASKKYEETKQTTTKFSIQTEEESTIVGLVFETLILSTWKHSYPSELDNINEAGHQLFEAFFDKIKKLQSDYLAIKRACPFDTASEDQKIRGAIAYAKLYLGYHNKVFCNLNSTLQQQITTQYRNIRHNIQKIKPPQAEHLKTQHKVRTPFINGIIDCVNMNENDFYDIFEIKASKKRDWNENALLQSIMYGICLYKTKFRVHLINVSSKTWQHYFVDLTDYRSSHDIIRNDIQLWNLNCFLSKNRTFHDENKKNLDIFQLFFLDGRIENGKLVKFSFFEVVSPTKVTLHLEFNTLKEIEKFLLNDFERIIESWNVKKIIVGRHIPKNYFKGDIFRYLYKENLSWEYYLYQLQWNMELNDDKENNIISWDNIISTTSIQIAEICERYNLIV
jgi:hypothetical protein